ncbi:hypothetical protein BDV24DRAFT_140021 [Aspergillus arachidicola]|uniref:Pleiotropic ABC efflux transporter N-terminal domain-containing protein n=1 Tax=Aspergillus arachidicola TaxID=656916 RepID=A0A5N6XW75_9EURO|nr:hypothetical protein BDV24DRAFT_140021 [Aspergillus arachidicola]
MWLLGTINPNPPRSQSVISHNLCPPNGAAIDDAVKSYLPLPNNILHQERSGQPFQYGGPRIHGEPASPNFTARTWMKMLLAIKSRDPDRYPDRTTGVAFKNLSVHGFGSPTITKRMS